MRFTRLLAVTASVLCLAASAAAQTTTTAIAASDASTTSSDSSTTSSVPAGEDVCIVSGEKLGSMGEPVTIEHNGRTVRFCCKSCVKQFQENPDEYLKKLDEGIIKAQGKDYPLKTCVVTGNELPENGGKEIVVNDQLVRLCCGGCEAKVKADPEQYLQKIKQ